MKMNCLTRMNMILLAGISFLPGIAAERSWKSSGAVNDWDWTEGGNWEGGVAPGIGDTALLPDSVTVRLLGTDEKSWEILGKLGEVKMTGAWDKPAQTTRLVIDTDADRTITVPLSSGDRYMRGVVVKRGSGTLSLSADSGNGAEVFKTSFAVEEGALRLPQSTANWHFTTLAVSNNATLYTVSGGGKTYCWGLWGGPDAVVTNSDTHGSRELHVLAATNGRVPPSVYAGRLTYGLRLFCSANFTVSGVENTMKEDARIVLCGLGTDGKALSGGCGVCSVAKIGNLGEPSSIGLGQIVYGSRGGSVRYIGTGEESDKEFGFQYPFQARYRFDAGDIGGIVFNGAWNLGYSSSVDNHGMGELEICGDNKIPCVMNGGIPQTVDKNGKSCSLHIIKSGSGAWRFSDSVSRPNATALTLLDGTLQFDSLEPKGYSCALGTAADTHSAYVGRYDASKAVPYAFLVGSSEGDATFELTGDYGAYSCDRPMALNGDVRFKNDTSAAFRFSGVFPLSDGEKIIRLSGTGDGENEIAGICDRPAAPVSLIKEGAGTWTLGVSNAFTGSLNVNAGTLRVRSRSGDYSWFRLTLKGTVHSCAIHPDWLPPLIESDQFTNFVNMREWFLLDSSFKKQNTGFRAAATFPSIEPGEISYFGRMAVFGFGGKSSNADVEMLCDSSAAAGAYELQVQRQGGSAPVPDNPDSWITLVLRLTNGTPRIAAYDFLCHTGTNNLNQGRCQTGGNIGAYVLEGSLDGMSWAELAAEENTMDPGALIRVRKNADCLMGGGGSYTAERAANLDYQWKSSPTIIGVSDESGSALDTVASVCVAPGAILSGVGGGVVIPALKVDAPGAGTIENCSFARNGTLEITGVESGSVELPLAFSNVRDLENVCSWKLVVNGRENKSRRILLRDGRVVVVPPGLTVIVR